VAGFGVPGRPGSKGGAHVLRGDGDGDGRSANVVEELEVVGNPKAQAQACEQQEGKQRT